MQKSVFAAAAVTLSGCSPIPFLDASIVDPSGTIQVPVNGLVRGRNRVCAKVSPAAVLTDTHAVSCVDVVFVPH